MTDARPNALWLSLPGWGMDQAGYEAACRYLGLPPDPALHAKLARYLLTVASREAPPQGFARWLAERRPGCLALGFLDLWTRLFMPSHPWRFRLNAIVALHECDAPSFHAMMAFPESRLAAWLAFARIGAIALANLVGGAVWLSGQACAYTFLGGGMRREQAYFGGKTVLVTGATRGLGLALSARLLSLGASVVGVARTGPAQAELQRQIAEAGLAERFRIVTADVAVAGALSAGLADASLADTPIDAAIVNAGVKEAAAVSSTASAMRRVFAVNVFGAMDTVSALLPGFLARGHGQFVFISSLGRWHGMARTGTYNASKAALSVLAESLAIDLQRDRRPIRTTVVEPGLIATGMIGRTGLQRLLAVDAERAACRVLQCATRGDAVCRFSLAFALFTLALACLPFRWRLRLVNRLADDDRSGAGHAAQ